MYTSNKFIIAELNQTWPFPCFKLMYGSFKAQSDEEDFTDILLQIIFPKSSYTMLLLNKHYINRAILSQHHMALKNAAIV